MAMSHALPTELQDDLLTFLRFTHVTDFSSFTFQQASFCTSFREVA